MNSDEQADRLAQTSVAVHPIIATRWSPRALVPAAEVPDDALRAMLEAARWAASSGNTQPARYLVGRRGDETFNRIFEVLSVRNQGWAHAASALLLGCAVTTNRKGELPMAEYGVGLASQNLVLQAVAEGFVAHQLGGFNKEGAKLVFSLPDDVRPLVVIAIGVLGAPDLLDEDRRAQETRERRRIPLDEFALTEWGRPAFPTE